MDSDVLIVQWYKWREQFVRTVSLYLSHKSKKLWMSVAVPSCCVSSCFVHKQISIYNNSSLCAGLFFRVWYAENNVRLTTAWVRKMCLTSLGWSAGRRSSKDVDTDWRQLVRISDLLPVPVSWLGLVELKFGFLGVVHTSSQIMPRRQHSKWLPSELCIVHTCVVAT